MTSQLTNISAMSLLVDDVAVAKDFYTSVFGVKVVFEDEASACVKFDHLYLNLLSDAKGGEILAPGKAANRDAGQRFQLSIWVDDVDAVIAHVTEKGATILSGPTDQKWGMRTAIFNDPAGHSWEVAQEIGNS
jgi:catechol 2,3-dioxygenase-like lactoylglutathione lyase family enzyme